MSKFWSIIDSSLVLIQSASLCFISYIGLTKTKGLCFPEVRRAFLMVAALHFSLLTGVTDSRDACFPRYNVSHTHILWDSCFPEHISLGVRVSHL